MAKKSGGKRAGAGGAKKTKWAELDMQNKLELVEGWARDGATDIEIFQALGVSQQTFYNWKSKFPEFAAAIRKGKEIIDIQVENALLKRALGYQYEEVTREEKYNPVEGVWEMVETKRVTKEMPPDVTGQIFWLKNRRPDKWRDRKQLDANITTNGFDYLSDAELEAEITKIDDDE